MLFEARGGTICDSVYFVFGGFNIGCPLSSLSIGGKGASVLRDMLFLRENPERIRGEKIVIIM